MDHTPNAPNLLLLPKGEAPHGLLYNDKDINSSRPEYKNFCIKPGNIRVIGEKLSSKLLDIGLSDEFLDLTPKSQGKKCKNKQVGLH